MADHPNIPILQKGYDAFGRGDMETIAEVLHQDVTWHVPGEGPLSGDHIGRDAVFAFFGQLAERTGATFKVELHDLLANDGHGVGLCNITGSREGKELNMKETHIYNMNEGKVIEAWSFPGDQSTYDAFWS